MNILFYIERLEDAHVAHALSSVLKSKLNIENISAITCRHSFEGDYLKNEAHELFSQVLSETEMHQRALSVSPSRTFLDTVESRYGLPFWHYVTHNRFLWMKRANYLQEFGTSLTREQLIAHIQVRFEMIEAFIEKCKPRIIIYPIDVGPSSALVLERIAKARGIPVFVPISSRIGTFHTIIDTVFSKASNIEKRFDKLNSGIPSTNLNKAKDIIRTFREGNVALSYMQGTKTDNFERRFNFGAAAKKIKDILRQRRKQAIFKHKFNDVFNLSQFEYDLGRAVLYYRSLRLRLGKYFDHPNSEDEYFFFPFHLEPELSLLLYAPYHTHQSSIAQNIAQSLPWNTYLYAKEHPLAVGTKSMGFYARMRQMTNVKMIYPHVSSRTLIAGSKGVITITGTAGVEGMIMQKPVIVLGNVFYSFVPGLVQRANSIEDLPSLIRNSSQFVPDEKQLETFVSALLDESAEVDPEQLGKALLPLSLEEKCKHPLLNCYADFLTQMINRRLAKDSLPDERV